jgi:hypothetical protein
MSKEERGGMKRGVNVGGKARNRRAETYTEEVLDETGNTLLLEALDGDAGRLTGKERVGGPIFLRVEKKEVSICLRGIGRGSGTYPVATAVRAATHRARNYG